MLSIIFLTGDNSMDYQDLKKELIEFRDLRDWKKYHNLKDLALSMNLEASEVLKIFQWKDEKKELTPQTIEDLKMEIADVYIYMVYMCEILGVDPLDLAEQKLQINKKRNWNFDEK